MFVICNLYMKAIIEISARHVHLTKHDLESLFGEGYELKIKKELSQIGQFASEETVTLVGPKKQIEGVRVLGPCRSITQIEVSRTDAIALGINAPLRLSGKIIGSGAVKLIGPKGELELKEGVIVAKRHIHLNPEQAREIGVNNGQNVKIRIDTPRALTFEQVEARIDEDYDMAIHLDTDEANAAGVVGEGEGEIIL